MKQKCERRRCKVLNKNKDTLTRTVGMLGIGVTNGDVRLKAKAKARKAESADSQSDGDDAEAATKKAKATSKSRGEEKTTLLSVADNLLKVRWSRGGHYCLLNETKSSFVHMN
jgi:hypothetical protein